MWTPGNQPIKTPKDFSEELAKINGELSEEQAKIYITAFLKRNLGVMLDLFAGVKLLPVQEILIKGILARDESLLVCGRGFGKSFLISILSIIYPIFNPNSKMCLISSNFRNARRILEYAERILNGKKAELLRQCFPNSMRRGNDIFQWKLDNQAEVFAVPLSSGGNGEGLRGLRCNMLALDETLLVPKEVIESVIRPFLTVKLNPIEEMEIREQENDLIAQGVMTDAERISFPKNKFAAFSSASYQFEYLYEMYDKGIQMINKPTYDKDGRCETTRMIVRASYESLPENSIMDMTQINAAKANGGENSQYFKREYRAIFSDCSDSYFNIKKMHSCTYPVGEFPTTQIIGDKDCKYLLTIDPSYSSSKNSDFFAMGVFLINESERKISLVHTYGKAGGDIKEHYEYLIYLLTYFNIVMVCIDGSGTEFINGFNESSIAKEKPISLDFLTEKLDAEDFVEYSAALAATKNSYNLSNQKIVWPQNFAGMGRRMNEHMQNMIDSGKLWFASNVASNDAAFKRYREVKLPFVFTDNKDKELGLIDFIESQDEWIKETKAQIALIEVKATSSGTMQYDLPQNLRQQNGVNKVRKDNYTTTLLGCWLSKIYFDLFFLPVEETQTYFQPIFIR